MDLPVEIRLEMRLFERRWSGFGGTQDAENEVVMVWACDKKGRGCPSSYV